MKIKWLPVEEIAIKGKKPWFKPKLAFTLSLISLLIVGVFYYPIIKGLFLGIQAFWLPGLIGSAFYFFWSYPRQLAAICCAILLWIILGPGIVGLWYWGVIKIFSFSGIDWLFKIILTVIWSSGPVAIVKKLLDNFGLLTICKKILLRSLNFKNKTKQG